MNGSVVSILAGVSVVMVTALGVTSALRRNRAAIRHALLTAAFAIALVLPAASTITPYITIRVPVPVPAIVTGTLASLDRGAEPAAIDIAHTSANGAPSQPTSGLSFAQILEVIWLLGLVAYLVPVALGLAEMRSLILGSRGLPWRHGSRLAKRLAAALRIRRRIGIVLHESVSGPMTFGTLRPTIVLPFDAKTWEEDELTRAIVHELEHIRRADSLTQCFARTICAAYWFNPLVWIARRQLVLEAERAADDAVLQYGDAGEYADQLVGLASRLSTGHQPFLAMANRHCLAVRVRALLDGRQSRGRAGAWLVAGLSCLAAALVMLLSSMRVVAQTPRPRFEVVSVKPCDPNAPSSSGRSGGGGGQASPGRFRLDCRTVNTLVLDAYVTFGDGRFSRPSERPIFDLWNVGPDWVRSERFTIEATTREPTPAAVMQGPMLQAVLEDRFKLKVHRETRDVPIYELVVAKGGSKLTPFKPGTCVPWNYSVFPQPALEPGHRRCTAATQRGSDDNWVETVEALTLDDWVAARGNKLGRPIVNKTGITGLQTFRRVYSGREEDFASEIQDQLGLELRPARGPREFLILDHVERPVPDEPIVPPARAMGHGG